MEATTITAARSIEQLPEVLLMKILSKLRVRDLVRCALVSKRFSELVWEVPELSFDIRTLGVQRGDGGRAFCSVVINIVRKMQNLRSLHLRGTDFSTHFLRHCLEHVGPSLQELKLYGMDILGYSKETTAFLLNCIFTHCTSLRNLDAQYKPFDPVDVHMAVMEAGGDGRMISATLQCLSIQLRVDNASNAEDLIEFISYFPSLRELHLAIRCENCALPITVEIDRLPMLEVLSVSFAKFDTVHQKAITVSAPALIDLTVRGAQRVIIEGESSLRKMEIGGGPDICLPHGVVVDCLHLVGYDEYVNFGWDGETLQRVLRNGGLFQSLTTLVIRDFYAVGQGSSYPTRASSTDAVDELIVAFQNLNTDPKTSGSSLSNSLAVGVPSGNGQSIPQGVGESQANRLCFESLRWLELGGVSVESFLCLNLGQGSDGYQSTWVTALPCIRGIQVDGEFSCLQMLLCHLVMFLSELLECSDSLKSVLVGIYDEHGEAAIACQNDADFDLSLHFQDLRALKERFRGILRLNLHAFDNL